jgi:hypothetical protein
VRALWFGRVASVAPGTLIVQFRSRRQMIWNLMNKILAVDQA